ncbi:hypothetical protein phi9184_ORF066 [Enterococcus phage 9184]|uniref:Uncharacterized protein n=1 Tax=Enterococcus phage 9184 TaxID=2763103 RepID=A0A7L8ZIX4_9CAUD|nr:hypothetical protein phi9184_ORF066 [Enterococcus phage 9184]
MYSTINCTGLSQQMYLNKCISTNVSQQMYLNKRITQMYLIMICTAHSNKCGAHLYSKESASIHYYSKESAFLYFSDQFLLLYRYKSCCTFISLYFVAHFC